MKLCIDCKYFDKGNSESWHQCKHPELSETYVHLVSGKKIIDMQYCSDLRYTGECGSEAKYFEQRPNVVVIFFKRIFK
ncbi:hypothetical protein [Synechococcus phage BUCT-ZZ01]|nr:hypothetical protein [Synechococcus phage BUCT-ZZ01]